MDENRRRWRGSIVWPVILIGIGIIFLLNNIGVLPGDVWSNILLLWPVLLILFGLDGILRREGLVGPVLLIGLGIVFLLSNLGYLALDVWQVVLRLWPVLLIAFGIDIIFGRRSALWSAIGLLLVVAVLIGALWMAGVRFGQGQVLASTEISQPVQGADRAQIAIKPAVGSLRLDAQPEAGALIQGFVRQGPGERVTEGYSVSGSTAHYTLDGSGVVFIGLPGAAGGNWGWDLSLAPDIPLSIETSLGAGEAEIDLSGLTVTGLNVDMGIGETTVILPGEGDFQGSIDGAIGQIVLFVPRGIGVRINADTGIAIVNAPDEFEVQGDVFTSPGYASAQQQIELDVSQAIGSIRILWK